MLYVAGDDPYEVLYSGKNRGRRRDWKAGDKISLKDASEAQSSGGLTTAISIWN